LGKLVVISGSKSDIHIIKYTRVRARSLFRTSEEYPSHMSGAPPLRSIDEKQPFRCRSMTPRKDVFCPKKGKKDGCGKVLTKI